MKWTHVGFGLSEKHRIIFGDTFSFQLTVYVFKHEVKWSRKWRNWQNPTGI